MKENDTSLLGFTKSLPKNFRVIPESNKIRNLLSDEMILSLSMDLGVQKRTIVRYIKRNRYPLKLIEKLNKSIDQDVFLLIEKDNPLFFSKWKKVTLPIQITPKLSYFVGYLQGDGSIHSNKKRIGFTDENRRQLERINDICEFIFGIRGNIRKVFGKLSTKPCYRAEIGSVVLNSYLHTVFKINRGRKENLRIPACFKKDKKIMRSYLRGLFDADGTLPKHPKKVKQAFIDISFKDKCFIEDIREELKKLGVRTLDPYCRISKSPSSEKICRTWELRIRRKNDIKKLLKTVGFSHPDKGQRVEPLLKALGP